MSGYLYGVLAIGALVALLQIAWAGFAVFAAIVAWETGKVVLRSLRGS